MPDLSTFDKEVMSLIDKTSPTMGEVIQTSLTLLVTTDDYVSAEDIPKLANALRRVANIIENTKQEQP